MINNTALTRPESNASLGHTSSSENPAPTEKKRKASFSRVIKSNLYSHFYECSHRILPRYSGDQYHMRAIQNLVGEFTSKYKAAYNINVMVCDNTTAKEDIKAYLERHENCALIHDGKPHHTPIVKMGDKLICISGTNYNLMRYLPFFPKQNIYFLHDDVFKKPPSEPVQDEEMITFQADDVSCGIFAIKMIKELLRDNGDTLKQTIFDEQTKSAYVHPKVFKQSQSNIFLKYYVKRYVDKMSEVLAENGATKTCEEKIDTISQELDNYRTENFGKARIFYYNVKYLPHVRQMYDALEPTSEF